jgi:ribonuclease P protein component
MEHRFPKTCHLLKNWEFQKVWKMGCKLHTPHFILLKMENSGVVSRLGLTVSKKVGSAVARNRLKRLTREFFRLNQHYFINPVDFSVVAKKGAAELSAAEIFAELKRVF